MRFAPLLAQSDSGAIGVIGWLIPLAILAVFGLFAIARVRRWLKADDDEPAGTGFTLGDLRDLHRRGKMTNDEFERAKAQLIAGTKAAAARLPTPAGFQRKVSDPQTGFDVLPPPPSPSSESSPPADARVKPDRRRPDEG